MLLKGLLTFVFIALTTSQSSESISAKGHHPSPPTCPQAKQSSSPCGCEEVYKSGCTLSGVYSMDCGCGAFQAYCNMQGNWTVFQRRFNGVVGFYRGWNDYVNGFGKPSGEYWLGLDHISCMTNTYPGTKLRVTLEDWQGGIYHAEYSHFAVGDSSTKYKLTVWGYSGNAGDQLGYHNEQQFTTYNADNDRDPKKNCAAYYRGGWWHNSCHHVNLNGDYVSGGVEYVNGTTWNGAKPGAGTYYSFKKVEMELKL